MHVYVSGQGQVEGTFGKIDVRCLYACVRDVVRVRLKVLLARLTSGVYMHVYVSGQGQVEGTFGKIDVRCLYACVREWSGLG